MSGETFSTDNLGLAAFLCCTNSDAFLCIENKGSEGRIKIGFLFNDDGTFAETAKEFYSTKSLPILNAREFAQTSKLLAQKMSRMISELRQEAV